MSCSTNLTIPQLCASTIINKPMNPAQAQANWNMVGAMNKLLCCLLDTEIISDVVTKVFYVTQPTTSFDMGIILPIDFDMYSVEWNGQDIYHTSNVDAGEVRFAIAGTTIMLTMPIGDVTMPCILAVKIKIKNKIGDIIVCPTMTAPTPNCNCLCGC